MKPVAIYARVSTERDEQEKSIDAQIDTLKKYCEFRGWTESDVFFEKKSGMKNEAKRPQLARMMALVRRGHYAGIVVTNVTRIGRHPLHNIAFWYELAHLRVNFTAVEDGIDTASPLGEALFVVFTALGKMQRDMISKSVKRGLEHAREKGVRLGVRLCVCSHFFKQHKDGEACKKCSCKKAELRAELAAADVLAFKGSLREAAAHFGYGKDKIAAIRNGSLTISKTE